MANFFRPNITTAGRVVRALFCAGLILGGFYAFATARWLAIALWSFAVFVAFEVFRGWCVMRACGVKTKW
jgi:hypothetical protein